MAHQITVSAVTIHGRESAHDEPGSVIVRLCSGPSGLVFELEEIGGEDPGVVMLTEEELAALPDARARLLDQFTRG